MNKDNYSLYLIFLLTLTGFLYFVFRYTFVMYGILLSIQILYFTRQAYLSCKKKYTIQPILLDGENIV